jgi:predicted HicB family RNase H-like nuclease
MRMTDTATPTVGAAAPVTLKKKITLTIQPAVARRAKRLARQCGTSLSGLVERELRQRLNMPAV